MHQKVIVKSSPITQRCVKEGDIGQLDSINKTIRVNGLWHSFDERWEIETIEQEPFWAVVKNQSGNEEKKPHTNIKQCKRWIAYMIEFHKVTPLKILCPDGRILVENISNKW
jgi:hypothetical protein